MNHHIQTKKNLDLSSWDNNNEILGERKRTLESLNRGDKSLPPQVPPYNQSNTNSNIPDRKGKYTFVL